MAETVRRAEYCYVTLQDRPGTALHVLSALKESGVNLRACLGFPSGGGRTQFDLFPENADALRSAAKRAGLELSTSKKAFLIQGEDRVGAVAETMRKLSEAGINVTALAASCADGRYGMMLWVAPGDYEKAARALGA